MRAFILTLVLALATFAQVELKGFKLGVKLTPQQLTTVIPDSTGYSIETTIGGHKGTLFIYTLSDGRVYQLAFSPELLLTDEQGADLALGLKEKYALEFELIDDEYEEDSGILRCSKNGINYAYIFDYERRSRDDYDVKLYDIILGMTSIFLEQIYKEEQIAKKNKDF